MTVSDPSRDPPGATTDVGVLDRSVAILDAVEHGARTHAAIVRATGLSRTTAHRLLTSLDAHGLLDLRRRRGYRLGPRLLSLAALSMREPPLRDVAHPALDRPGGIDGRECAALRRVDRRPRLRRCRRVVQRAADDSCRSANELPLWAGSAGKVFLAAMPPDQAERHSEHAGAHAATPTEERLRPPDRHRPPPGWAASAGERQAGVGSVSAPVRGPHGASSRPCRSRDRRRVSARPAPSATRPPSWTRRAISNGRSATRRRPRARRRPGRGRSRRARSSVVVVERRSRARAATPSSCSIVRGPMIGAVTAGLVQQPGQRDVGRLLAELGAELLLLLELRRGASRSRACDVARGAPAVGLRSSSAPPSSPPPSGLHGITPDAVRAGTPGAPRARPCARRGCRGSARTTSPRKCRRARGLVRLRDVPAGEVAAADVEHLALLRRAAPSPARSRPTARRGRRGASGRGRCGRSAAAAGWPRTRGGCASADSRPSFGQSPIGAVDLGGEHDLLAPAAALREPAADDLLGRALALLPAVARWRCRRS